MKIVKMILSILAAAFVFVGTVGVDVFSHTCKVNGTFVSIVFEPSEDHCVESSQNLMPCCQNSQSDHLKDDCCDENVNRFQVKLDFVQEHEPFQIVAAVVPSFDLFHIDDLLLINREVRSAGFRPPPLLLGRDFQILYDTWLI